MASIEQIGERIFRQDGVWLRLVIGGALMLSIVGIPLAFGYLFAYAFRLKEQPDAPLPPWENWSKLFVVGLHALAIFLGWFLAPVGAAMLITALFALVPGGVLELFGWLAVGVVEVIALALFASALKHYQEEQRWGALIEFEAIFNPLERAWKALVIPGLAWVGLMTIGVSILPFTFFLGMLLFLAYAIPVISAPSRD